MTLEEKYRALCAQPSDIREHLPLLRAFASQCTTIVELGVRCGVSTVGLLMGGKAQVYSYDVEKHHFLEVDERWGNWKFILGDSTKVVIPFCDLLFIDTIHTKAQLEQELILHAPKTSHWIILHDTATYGEKGEDGGPGINEAIEKFTAKNPWSVLLDLTNNNGLMVLQRTKSD